MYIKEQLIDKIKRAFEGQTLDDGIGLWEAQGIDDRLTQDECKRLRIKDEKEDWNKIPVIDLYKCSSSFSFFDAKGMRFHLPIFMLLALGVFRSEERELEKNGLLKSTIEPDIEFHLLYGLKYLNRKDETGKRTLEYHNERFSLLTSLQLQSIVEFLKYRISEIKEYSSKEVKMNASGMNDDDIIQLEKGVEYWTKKMIIANQ